MSSFMNVHEKHCKCQAKIEQSLKKWQMTHTYLYWSLNEKQWS